MSGPDIGKDHGGSTSLREDLDRWHSKIPLEPFDEESVPTRRFDGADSRQIRELVGELLDSLHALEVRRILAEMVELIDEFPEGLIGDGSALALVRDIGRDVVDGVFPVHGHVASVSVVGPAVASPEVPAVTVADASDTVRSGVSEGVPDSRPAPNTPDASAGVGSSAGGVPESPAGAHSPETTS